MSPDCIPDGAPPWLVPILERLDRLTAALEAGRVPSSADEWLSAEGLAKLLGVSERSIRTWELCGKIPPPVKVGRLKKWNRREVQTHLSNAR